LQFEIAKEQRTQLDRAPYFIVCRHVSLFDASLPALALVDIPIQVRGVIMAELLADPGFDLLYGRLGSVFIPRENGPEARAIIDGLGQAFDRSTVVALFPEGRLFRPEVRDRALASLAAKQPARAKQLAGLQSSLPPRTGGFVAVLAAAPHIDVVTMNHRGLEPFARFGDLLRHVPLREPIQVDIQRTSRSTLPSDPDALTAWLDHEWLRMDTWVTTKSD
jgi:1-acyl-sn-glycerol-3-phosphate acyltransferase